MAESPLPKKLRNLMNLLKDKTSLILAVLSIRRHASSIYAPVLRATTHDFSAPPSDDQISTILYIGHNSTLTASACVNALMDRLHQTRSATVSLKCLFAIHNIINRGSSLLREQLSYYLSHGSRNFLNLSMFCDSSDSDTLELSSWVRWYAGVLEQSIMVQRVLRKREKVVKMSNSDLLFESENLVDYVEKINKVPDSLHLQRNDLVYEVVKMVGEDYRWVQGKIFKRVVEIGNRATDGFDSEMLTRVISGLQTLEDCKERLRMLFVNKVKNEDFWELIGETKKKAMVEKKQRGEKRMIVVEETRKPYVSRNPFLEPGQLQPWPTVGGGSWFGEEPLALTFPTVR